MERGGKYEMTVVSLESVPFHNKIVNKPSWFGSHLQGRTTLVISIF